MFGKLFCAIR